MTFSATSELKPDPFARCSAIVLIQTSKPDPSVRSAGQIRNVSGTLGAYDNHGWLLGVVLVEKTIGPNRHVEGSTNRHRTGMLDLPWAFSGGPPCLITRYLYIVIDSYDMLRYVPVHVQYICMYYTIWDHIIYIYTHIQTHVYVCIHTYVYI